MEGSIAEYTVTKFGVPYTVTIECTAATKAQCQDIAQIAKDSALLKLIAATPPDQPAPRRGKFWQLLPAVILTPPLCDNPEVLAALRESGTPCVLMSPERDLRGVVLIGALALATKWPNPWPRVFGFHEVFHAFTVVAASLQFVAIAAFVAPRLSA